ncbi:MAG: hypothetical protein AAGF02_18575 [Actinomycetota bacterium]
MRARGLAVVLAVAVLAGACTSDDGNGSEPTATTTGAPTDVVDGAPTPDDDDSTGAVPSFPDDDDPLPVDEAVLIGQLDNGVRY